MPPGADEVQMLLYSCLSKNSIMRRTYCSALLALSSALGDAATLVAQLHHAFGTNATTADSAFMLLSGITARQEMCLTVGGGNAAPC